MHALRFVVVVVVVVSAMALGESSFRARALADNKRDLRSVWGSVPINVATLVAEQKVQ